MMNKGLINNFPRTFPYFSLLCLKVSYAVLFPSRQLKAKSAWKRIKRFSPVVGWQQGKQSQRRQLPPLRLSDVVHSVNPHLYNTAQQLVHLRRREKGKHR